VRGRQEDMSNHRLKRRDAVEQLRIKLGGKRTIQRILLANNGMASTKAIMSMRQWAFMNFGR
jgi:hypothetical protein